MLMGYRSEVLYKIDNASKPILLMYQLAHPTQWHTIQKEFKNEICMGNDGSTGPDNKSGLTHCFRLHLDHVKWYESYDDVQAMNHFWSYLCEHEEVLNLEIDAVFIRIGEEDGDIEHESLGNGYDLAHPYTTIDET